LTQDSELREVLTNAGYEPTDISSGFRRVNPPRLTNLISSDLDADRIDYLLRTAHHTGLPYGSVDIDYFLSQMRVDERDRICITPRALRTADHFLLSRYFDYQQVPYHKTVAALELVLKDVIAELLEQEKIDGSAEWVSRTVVNGEWPDFDDGLILRTQQMVEQKRDDVAQDLPQQPARQMLQIAPTPSLRSNTPPVERRRYLYGSEAGSVECFSSEPDLFSWRSTEPEALCPSRSEAPPMSWTRGSCDSQPQRRLYLRRSQAAPRARGRLPDPPRSA
jgi:HD superfamily phosphohydrolase